MKILPPLSLVLACCLNCAAQDARSRPTWPEGIIIDPFDTYQDISWEQEKYRLDSFAIELLQSPELVGYYVVYAGRRSCAGEARARGRRAKEYLVEHRGVERDRIVWQDAGYLPVPYVMLETQRRGAEPYPYFRPQPLDSKGVRVIDCARGANGRGRTSARPRAAPNSGPDCVKTQPAEDRPKKVARI